MAKKNGFTLIELMIVVAIIAFLAMISVPTFKSFLAKAKRSEAYMMLNSIYAAEKAYWAQHGRYTTQLAGSGGAGWKPEGYANGGSGEKFYYTYGFAGAEGSSQFTGKLQTALSGAQTYADENGFLAVAIGDIDGDGQPDILTVDHTNTITLVQDDLG